MSHSILFGWITIWRRQRRKTVLTGGAVVSLTQVHEVVTGRCSSCHANSPTQVGFQSPPKGIVFESADDVVRQAAAIYQQTVVTKAMPIGNLTGISDDKRRLIGTWFEQN